MRRDGREVERKENKSVRQHGMVLMEGRGQKGRRKNRQKCGVVVLPLDLWGWTPCK